MARADLDGVAAERRDPAAGVAEDRDAVLVGEREHVGERRVIEVEALGARMQLDPARARLEAAPGLGEGIVLRVEPAERKQPAVARGRLRGDHVVRGRVPVRLVHREHERRRVDAVELLDQLSARAAVAVGVVAADVRVHVEHVEARDLGAHPLVPGQQSRV
jgi:hypothetical protein